MILLLMQKHARVGLHESRLLQIKTFNLVLGLLTGKTGISLCRQKMSFTVFFHVIKVLRVNVLWWFCMISSKISLPEAGCHQVTCSRGLCSSSC